jgi:aspartyl-tRNA(Asn)/glutamyl-tRNA(Gln) amidotransferase subunit A
MVTTQSELCHLTVIEAAELIKTRQVSPVELLQSYLDRIDRLESKVGAWAKLDAKGAMAAAKQAEAEIAAGDYRGPLHGITFSAKDQLDSEGAPSFMRGSRGESYDFDATPIASMKKAGAVYMGKVIMSGMDPVETPQPRNPWDLSRGCAGSSSGSGAAVSASFCTVSLGEDSAGSVRSPSSSCGLVGAIGTYGRVSRRGLANMAWTLDRCGPLTRSVKDTALTLETISGYDPADLSSSKAPAPDFTSTLEDGVKDTVIGVPRKYIEDREVDAEVMAAFEASLETLESLGAKIEEFDIAHMDMANPAIVVYYANEMFAANLDGFHEWLETVPRSPRQILSMAALTSGPDYLQAQRYRTYLRAEYRKVMSKVDVVATPCQAKTAAVYGAPSGPMRFMQPGFTAMFSVTGMPAMTMPNGFDSDGLPIGLQFAASPFDEAAMLKTAYAYEQATSWHTRRAPL